MRTWAPRGHTPVLQYHFNWKVLSAAAGISWWNFYFRLYPMTIRGPQVVDFLGHLLRHLPGKLLVVWDRLPAHRARMVSDFIAAQPGRLAIEWLPGHTLAYNPVPGSACSPGRYALPISRRTPDAMGVSLWLGVSATDEQ